MFLVSLLDNLIHVSNISKLLLSILSRVYDLFEIFIKEAKKAKLPNDERKKLISNEPVFDKPINVFYLNKSNVKQQSIQTIKQTSRVEIIRNKDKSYKDLGQQIEEPTFSRTSTDFTTKDARMFMKKIEFYFKWISENKAKLKEKKFMKPKLDSLGDLYYKMTNEFKILVEEKQFFDKNLNKLRNKQAELLNKEKLIKQL